MRDVNQYLKLLMNDFLPSGRLAKNADSNLSKVFNIPAKELALIDARVAQLRLESDPRSTSDLLDDWEFCAGLPDACDLSEKTLVERQNRLVQKLISVGGASREYFKNITETLGYDSLIEEYRPIECGDFECGDYTVEEEDGVLLYGFSDAIEHDFHWNMRISGSRITLFECGVSECGDYMANITEATDLICITSKLKPAHTNLTTIYEE